MKSINFIKSVFLTVLLAASVIVAGFSMTCCGEKPDKDKEVAQALSAVGNFLANAEEGGNYTSISEYSDGRIYEYYIDDGKIRIEYNGTSYAEKGSNYYYKIYQADDLTWHKNNIVSNPSEEKRIDNLIKNINAAPWNAYDKETKILTCILSDGSCTIKLDADEFVFTVISDAGTTKHIIKNVGNTTVTLPENIIDDTVR